MQKGPLLHFNCSSCKQPVRFSILKLADQPSPLACCSCEKLYVFDDPRLRRQLAKFEKLCLQIAESEEILGDASIGIDVKGHQVKIPYRLLLTRLTSSLQLSVGGERETIEFRFEPTREMKS